MTSYAVVLNPVAGGGRLLRRRTRMDAVAHQLGIELRWRPTSGPGHATELARAEAAAGAALVFAFGGDGTYNEVGRGLLGTDTALAALPGGTTSVLAYELGIPRPAELALAPLLAGRDRPMRPGVTDRGDIFLLMLSSGPDAVVLEEVGVGMKRYGGRLGVAAAAVRELMRRRPLPEIQLTLDRRPRQQGGWVIVGRSRSYAGPFHATPGADPFGDELEVMVQTGRGRRPALAWAFGLALRRHHRRPDVVLEKGRRAWLAAANGQGAVPYQVDGDPAGVLPVEAGLADQRVVVRLPALT